ncbi:MAG: MucBP domain-containing protein, partial [Bombilactobacillus sp.]
KGDELNGKTQPGNVKYTSSAQTVTVYVAGDPVDSKNNALSQITVHHYLKDTTTTVPGMSDTKIGGFIGDEITVDPTAEAHKAPAGYSLEANQAAVKWTLKPNEGKEIIIYYTASEQANITVKYVDVATGEVVFEDKPQGHTGGILDLSENGAGLAKLPEGYHYAKSSELQSGQSQPTNPVYTTENQTKIVYVAGNIVANNAENAVTVHHYLENTTTTVPGMKDIHRGGRVGQTLTFQTTDPEQQAPQGYTLVTQEAQSWKLKAKEAGNLIFYYKAKDLSNVAIKFVNSQNGKEVKTDYPIKATGTTLNITDPNGEYLKAAIPAGYHYATSNELKTGQQQPNKDLTYTPQPQEA